MTDPSPPSWVRKCDGRLVPFEADRISRALFAATEGLGRPDAFLARELADSVVHFLAQDGLEHLAAGGRSVPEMARQGVDGLERTGLYGVVNLNVAAPPSWADPLATGPLFADPRPSPGRLRALADELFAEFARLA